MKFLPFFKMEKTVMCRFGRCLHNSKYMPVEEAIEEKKGFYYHPDCLRTKRNIEEIIDVFATKCNPNVIFATLRNVLNIIIFDHGFDSGKLLYGINWCIDHKWNLRYPQGLYRVAENVEWQEEYDRKAQKAAPKPKVEIIDEIETQDYSFKPTKQKSFGDILK